MVALGFVRVCWFGFFLLYCFALMSERVEISTARTWSAQ